MPKEAVRVRAPRDRRAASCRHIWSATSNQHEGQQA